MARIDQLPGGRRRLGQDAEPGEGIGPFVSRQDAGRNARPADAVKAVAAGDEVAGQLVLRAVQAIADARLAAVDIVDRDVRRLETDLSVLGEAQGDHVLHRLVLTVDRDRAAAGQVFKIDPVAAAGEANFDAPVDQALAPQAFAEPRLDQGFDGDLLQHAGPDPALHVSAAARLENDRFDALQMQKPRQQEPGWPGADDADLCARHISLSHQRPCTRSTGPQNGGAGRRGWTVANPGDPL